MGKGTQLTVAAATLSLAAGSVGWWLASRRFAEGTGSYVPRPGEVVTTPAAFVEPMTNLRTARQRTFT